MIIRGIKTILFFVYIVFVLLSCSKKTKYQNQSDVLVESYRLIDEQRTDEAIQLLENALKQDGQNKELKVALASAFAHKAGFKVQKLVTAIKQIEKLSKVEKEEKKNKQKREEQERARKESGGDSNNDKKIDENAFEVAFLLQKYTIFLETFASIPSVSNEQSKMLLHAVSIMNELGTNIEQKHAVYRAILNILIVKYYMTDGLVNDPELSLIKNKETCEIDTQNLSLYFRELGQIIIDIHYDFAIAQPNHADGLKNNAKSIANSLSIMALQAANGVDVNQIFQTVLNKEMLGTFLQAYVQCD